MNKHWYDINGHEEEVGIFASFFAISEHDALTQFLERFPYATIDSINRI